MARYQSCQDASAAIPQSKVHGTNIRPTWVLSAPGGPHVGLVNLAIWGSNDISDNLGSDTRDVLSDDIVSIIQVGQSAPIYTMQREQITD